MKTQKKEKITKPYTKKSFTDKFKELLSPQKLYLIRMQMRNGMHRSFTILQSKQNFKYSGGAYIIDPQMRYYDIDRGMWVLDFHEDFSLPVSRDIKPALLKRKIESENRIEVENATNPEVLQTFLTSKVAEGVMRGQQIDDFLRSMRIMVAITMVAAVGHFLVFVFKSGMLNSVKLW